MAQQGQRIAIPQKAKEDRMPLYSFLDTPTLRIVYGHLSGFDLADARVVAKRWNNFITCWDTDLPCIFLEKVSVKSLKVWLEEGGQKKAIHVEITEGSRPYTHSRGDATDFGLGYEYRTLSFTVTSQEELSEKLPPLLRSSYIHCFRFQNLFLRARLAAELGTAARTVRVGDFLFDNVSFNALSPMEFQWFFFDFYKIASVDMENCTVPREHINNEFLLNLTMSGVRKLLLPKHHPLGAEEYLMGLEGVSDFLNRAPEGRIELAASHLSPTIWNQLGYVKEIRTALLRPNCSMNLFIFGHKADPDRICLLKNLDGSRCGPPPAKRPRIVADSRLQVDVEPTVIRVATQSILRTLELVEAGMTVGKDAWTASSTSQYQLIPSLLPAMPVVTHFSSLRTLNTAQFFRRRTEASVVLTMHSRLQRMVRPQMHEDITALVRDVVQGRRLRRNRVHIKLHVQTAPWRSFFTRFRSRASRAAREALERLDRRMPRWEKVLGKNGCVEAYVSGTRMSMYNCGPQPHVGSLPHRNRYAEAQLERARVQRQGLSRWDISDFDLATLRPGYFFSSEAAHDHFIAQYRIARRLGRAVPVPRPHFLRQPMRVEYP
ncbi:hypothetical protein AAVH_24330 [Aphelenchoides avenae]|nr:hypothetical protein AAVH_24330 [Aphelenchus avenae]